MASLILLKESIDGLNAQKFQSGIDDLILIERGRLDFFYKNSELEKVEAYYDLYQSFSQENQARCKFLEQLTPHEKKPKSLKELQVVFPNAVFGFLGINFPQLGINEKFCVNTNKVFSEFKSHWQTLITHNNFSELKLECFPNIIFCDNSEDQLKNYGTGRYFNQCLGQFIELESYLKEWTQGNFRYQDLKNKTNITLSPESATTMRKYKNERIFSLPNGKKDVFELHIKLGDIRIHVLEDNYQKKMMIGYIGPHLTI